MNNQQQPVYIMAQDTQKTSGKDAQRNNIMAAKAVAEAVRTTLGPKGMDKMIVDSMGDTTVTNDGVTILQEMQIEHPTAKMIVEVAKTQDSEVGDGTTTAVILAGELLKNAEQLLDKSVHPTVIVKGYQIASEEARRILEEIAETSEDFRHIKDIISTAITGKGAESSKEKLVSVLRGAIDTVTKDSKFDSDDIRIEKVIGGSTEDTELIEGIVIEKEMVHSSMAKEIGNAHIALLDCALEIEDSDAKVQVTDPDQLQAFMDREETLMQDMAFKIHDAGAGIVFCQKNISDVAQHFLLKQSRLAVKRVAKSDLEWIAKATGGKIISKVDELTADDLGEAKSIEQKKVCGKEMIFIEGFDKPKIATILLRGSTEQVCNENERALADALGVVKATMETGKIVGGAGAVEIELSRKLREFANSLSGREQLAVMAFADAMEVVPRTLSENAGLDSIDLMAELVSEHEKGNKWAGIDVYGGHTMDVWEVGVIEPLKIKLQAISSASEVAQMILRIDDVILGGERK